MFKIVLINQCLYTFNLYNAYFSIQIVTFGQAIYERHEKSLLLVTYLILFVKTILNNKKYPKLS